MRHSNRLLFSSFVLILVAIAPASSVLAEEEGLVTGYTLYIGHPDKTLEPGGTVLILPGTLLPDMEDREGLDKQLKQAYRLQGLERQDDYMKHMQVGADLEIVSPAPGMDIHMKLVGFNDEVATYKVEIAQDGTQVANTPVSVKRGGRAVIGSQDGEAAPYIFIVLRPEAAGKNADEDKPQILERINPRYPELARKNQISGNVVVEAKVFKDGTCEVLRIVESPDELLSEAAREAVNQWTFRPGRDSSGASVDTVMRFVVSFKLR